MGNPLADRLGYEFIDADPEIEARAGKTIREIFDTDGEPTFREIERTVMHDLLNRKKLVIAAGGGAVVNDQTRDEAIAAGPVVWLKASVETLEQRIYGDVSTEERRPNLTGLSGRDEIEQVLTAREPIYASSASLTVHTDGCTIDEIVEQILAVLPNSETGGGQPA